jgi:hypothetical protein
MDFKRQPFLEKEISEISPENDIGVCILGKIIDISGRNFIIDDGTGNASAYFVNEEALQEIKTGDTIRLFGFVMPNPGGFEIKGDFLQKMNNLDMELYRKVVLKKSN